MLPPYAARPPVNGSTVPIRSVNEHFAAWGDAVDAVAVSAARIPAPASTTTTRLSLLHLTTGLPPVGPAAAARSGGAQCCNSDRYFAQRQGMLVMLAAVDVRAPTGSPNVGAVIRRLRTQRGIS